ncbi:MAG TPA: hypothetical protein VFP96_01315 [Candidatus Acidoferrum sp.]|nr:hypothetical protein [Candidatus Acidoferrum sp.]
MVKFNIFLPYEAFGFEPPMHDRSGIRVVWSLLAVFIFLFFLTGGASWFARGAGFANLPIAGPQVAPVAKPLANSH